MIRHSYFFEKSYLNASSALLNEVSLPTSAYSHAVSPPVTVCWLLGTVWYTLPAVIYFIFYFFLCSEEHFLFLFCTVSGCDGGNRTRSIAMCTWRFSLLSYDRHPINTQLIQTMFLVQKIRRKRRWIPQLGGVQAGLWFHVTLCNCINGKFTIVLMLASFVYLVAKNNATFKMFFQT